MKISFSHTIFNTESTERIPLIINGVNVGDYSFGLYSQWMINRVNNNMRDIPDVPIYLCWLIKERFCVEMKNPEAVLKAQELCGGNIGKWFERIMEQDLC